jgi:hypothetical protein
MNRGLVCYPGNGTADGIDGDHVLLAPPFIATDDELDMIVDRLGSAIDAALAEVAHERRLRHGRAQRRAAHQGRSPRPADDRRRGGRGSAALPGRRRGRPALCMSATRPVPIRSMPGSIARCSIRLREAVGDAIVLQITTEAVGRFTPAEQMATVRAVRPEAVSIALREIFPDGAEEGPVRDFFAWVRGEGIWLQVILYDVADVERFVALHAGGLFAARRPSALLVLGRYTAGQRSEPEDLDPLLDALAPVRPAVPWAVCAFGPEGERLHRARLRRGRPCPGRVREQPVPARRLDGETYRRSRGARRAVCPSGGSPAARCRRVAQGDGGLAVTVRRQIARLS